MDVDVAPARQLALTNMVDTCRIERDEQGYYDDVLDINTGQLAPRPPVPVVVYAGPCLLSPAGVGQAVEGAVVVERRGYRARLPYDAPTVRKGDRFVVTAARDVVLAGRTLRAVDGSQGGTYRVVTTVQLEDVEGVEPA